MAARILSLIASTLLAAGVIAAVELSRAPHQASSGVPEVTPTRTSTSTPTFTPTPTSNRPPPEVSIDMTVNGQQGPITVGHGAFVTYHWVVVASAEPQGRTIFVTVNDDTYDELDGTCSPYTGTCEKSAVIQLLTPGKVTNTVTAEASASPPGFPICCDQDQDSVSVFVGAVGGLATAPDAVDPHRRASMAPWLLSGVAIAVLALLVATAALYKPRRT